MPRAVMACNQRRPERKWSRNWLQLLKSNISQQHPKILRLASFLSSYQTDQWEPLMIYLMGKLRDHMVVHGGSLYGPRHEWSYPRKPMIGMYLTAVSLVTFNVQDENKMIAIFYVQGSFSWVQGFAFKPKGSVLFFGSYY